MADGSLADLIHLELEPLYGTLIDTDDLMRSHQVAESIEERDANHAYWKGLAPENGSLNDMVYYTLLGGLSTGPSHLLDELGNFLVDENGDQLIDG